MKAENLMLGDYVYLIDPDTKGRTIVQVTQVDMTDSMAHYFSPIPLTPELLEKNGFREWRGEDCEWRYERLYWGTGVHVVVSKNEPCEKAGVRISIDLGEPKWGAWHALNLYNKQYVHEFQHALKLCGIEEKIII